MKVLLADDDEAMRQLVETVLAAVGHEVVTVADGAAAWAAFERERPSLLLLDWQMPELSGIELCERVRQSDAARETFIIMVTARDTTADLQRLLDAGADDYLSKPFPPEALVTRLVIAERRITIDRARRTAEEALAQARWLAGIGETALALQHEINNPLAALLGNVALLTAGLAAPGEEAELIKVVAEQATRIGAVVKRLGSLREPRSVRYIGDAKMLDLSPQAK
jgi:two-component system, NtrC family, sensor kinase